MDFTALSVTVAHSVAHIILNRPDKANALDETLWQDIRRAFEWADVTPEVRVVVLSGAGRHFCSGIDLTMLLGIRDRIEDRCDGRKREKLLAQITALQQVINSLELCRKPVIAAIHGACMGAGVDLVLAADIRYASADAYFAVKEIDMGMTADVGTLQRLPKVVGEGVAREWCLTGCTVRADEAQAQRLVNCVLPDVDALHEHALRTAQVIAAKSPLAVRGTKQALNYSRDHSVADGLYQIAQWNAAALLSDDLSAAVLASMGGTQAVFAD